MCCTAWCVSVCRIDTHQFALVSVSVSVSMSMFVSVYMSVSVSVCVSVAVSVYVSVLVYHIFQINTSFELAEHRTFHCD